MAIVDKKNLTSVREYIREIAIIGLAVAVITLFKLYNDLQNYLVHTFQENQVRLELVIEHNTEVIKDQKQK